MNKQEKMGEDIRIQSGKSPGTMTELVFNPEKVEFETRPQGTSLRSGELNVTEMTKEGWASNAEKMTSRGKVKNQEMKFSYRGRKHMPKTQELVFNPSTNEFEPAPKSTLETINRKVSEMPNECMSPPTAPHMLSILLDSEKKININISITF